MLRVVHAYNVKPGVNERAFVEWLDSQLDEVTKRFGCVEVTKALQEVKQAILLR